MYVIFNIIMKILCTTSSFNANSFPSDYEVIKNPYKRKLTEGEVIALIKEHDPDGIIAGVEPLTRKVLETSDKLKVISRCGVGLDSVDMNAASEKKIIVFNTPDVPVKPVAELTIGMIFYLVRGIGVLTSGINEGNWVRSTGGLVAEKTIGIIGCGRIGSRVACLLAPSGARLIGYDPFVKEHPICRMVSFEYLLTNSDVISLHVPLTPENDNLLSAKNLQKTKPGTIIINNSRGGLVDEKALYELLKAGHLGGAGMDVFTTEPYIGPLTGLENVILTPHIGSSAGNSRMEMESSAIKNLVTGLNNFVLNH